MSVNEQTGVPGTVLSDDGTRLGVIEYGSPSSDPGAASVLFVPALGVPLGYYSGILTKWSLTGRHIVAIELRGMPLTPVIGIRRQKFGYATLVRRDLPAVVSDVLTGPAGFITVGHSLGGQLALLATAAGAIRPRGVMAIASGTSSPVARTTRAGRALRRGQVAFIGATSALLGYWPGDRLGFGGRQPRSLMRDWCYEGTHGRYRSDEDIDFESALHAITTPVRVLSLAGDQTIPEAAVEQLMGRLPGSAEHHRLSSTQTAGFDHIRWVRKEPQPVINAVEAWVSLLEREQ